MVYERRIELNVETRKKKVEVPPFAPEHWDGQSWHPSRSHSAELFRNQRFLYFSDRPLPVFWGNNQCQTQNPQVHPWARRLGNGYHGNQLWPHAF